VGVSFNQRSNRVYQKAKALLAERKLGTIRSATFTITTWYRSDAYYRHNPWRGSYSLEGGGSLINQCIHQIDLIYWLFGLPSSVEANCQTIDRKISAENDALALLKYPTYTLVLRAASHELKGENCLTVSGDQGKLVIHEKGMVAYFHDDEKDVNARTKVGYGHAHSHRHYYGYGLQRLVADLTRGQQLRSLRAFRDAIRGRGKLLCPVEDGVGATTLLNAIYLASWEKKEIVLPFDPASYEAALEKKRQEEKQCK
jgi:predicted dehydrogenase